MKLQKCIPSWLVVDDFSAWEISWGVCQAYSISNAFIA